MLRIKITLCNKIAFSIFFKQIHSANRIHISGIVIYLLTNRKKISISGDVFWCKQVSFSIKFFLGLRSFVVVVVVL